MSAAVHIHAPQPSSRDCRRTVCPVCHKRSVILAWFVEWYGWNSTCLRCGDRWADGEILPRPFYRYWRRDSIAAAKKYWRAAAIARATGADHD